MANDGISSKVKVCFRVDASPAMGSGHLMRCLALADELHERGAAILFATRSTEQPWRTLVRQHGYQVASLPESTADWAGDAEETGAALVGSAWLDWLVVDHYELGSAWETAMRAACGRILAIDDIGRRHDCDLLLDQNVLDNPESYRDRVPAHCRRLLGPSYALLRREFREERTRLRHRTGRIARVLISFGGSDPTGETGKAIEGLLAADLEGVTADVILGSANPKAADIQRIFGTQSCVRLIPHTDHMATLMAEADLAIGAGGSTTWERCCMGLPSITLSVAPNQDSIARDSERAGVSLFLGSSDTVDAEAIRQALVTLATQSDQVAKMASRAAALGDGGGTDRLASILLGDGATGGDG